MKIAVIITRVLLGLLYAAAAIVFLFKLGPQDQHPTGDLKTFTDGIAASGYLMTLIKVTELVCGIALVSGFFAPLATVVIFPVAVNILFTHALLAPEGLPVAIFVVLANLFLAYAYRKHYESLCAVKGTIA